MIYIVAIGKLAVAFGILLFLISSIPWIIALFQDTKHSINAWLDTSATIRAWGIGIFLTGVGLILFPYLLPVVIKVILVIFELIINILLLPIKMVL